MKPLINSGSRPVEIVALYGAHAKSHFDLWSCHDVIDLTFFDELVRVSQRCGHVLAQVFVAEPLNKPFNKCMMLAAISGFNKIKTAQSSLKTFLARFFVQTIRSCMNVTYHTIPSQGGQAVCRFHPYSEIRGVGYTAWLDVTPKDLDELLDSNKL